MNRLSVTVFTVPLVALLLLALPLVQGVAAQESDTEHEQVRVLFLGDEGHHQPTERARIIQPVFAERGIHMTYTDRVEDLRAERLGYYDVVLIYANHTYLPREEEQALLEFVREGGGLAAVHSASAMFGNSEAYIKLVGGAFKAHGAGVFQTTQVEPDHPAIEGVPEIESWDETYVHHKHNPTGRTVLSVRIEDDHEEPWTWVREHGEGRVFYTAWGHDERTWSNEDFQRLIEQGVRWAAGDWALRIEDGVSTLDYEESDEPLPYYPEGERWGTTGEPIHLLQRPLSPDESMRQSVLPPGFELHLFASEPDVVNPIDMVWDEAGRLWVAETFDYPNQIREGEGNDRIRILEDTTGDGQADTFTTFAEGLNIPTGLVLANGGVVVAQVPDMLFLKDTTGDGQADHEEVLFTGWGTFDTHAGPSNLQYGFDNQIWGSVGYAGFDGEVGGERHEFGQGFYRFPQDGSKLEYLARTSNNTWGLGFNEDGIVFGSTANGNAAVYMGIPGTYYDRVEGWSLSTLETIANSMEIYPITKNVRQVDHHGQYTSASGFQLYTAREFPREYWNRMAFVSEPTGHLLGRYSVEPSGGGFAAKNEWSMIASRDEWASPIQAKVGPDGMLWVIDWYNLVIQHNPTPEGFEVGPGNAYETELRDREHARIYRIVPEGRGAAYEPKDLGAASGEELVEALRSDNMFWRLTAQRLLVERGEEDVLSGLYELIKGESTDAVGLRPAAVHALWTLRGLGVLGGGAVEADEEALEVALRALYHPASGVRRAALMTLPRTEEVRDAILETGALPEPEAPGQMDYVMPAETLQEADSQVRLAVLLAMAEMPRSERAGRAVAEAALVEENLTDAWLHGGLIAAGAQHGEDFLKASLEKELPAQADSTYRARAAEVVQIAGHHYASEAPSASISEVMVLLKESDPDLGGAFLAGVLSGWPDEEAPSFEERDRERLAGLSEAVSEEQREDLDELAERWGEENLFR